MTYNYSNFLSEHLNPVLLKHDVWKFTRYSRNIIGYDLSDLSLSLLPDLLKEIGFEFTGEYGVLINKNSWASKAIMSNDKYPWQSKPKNTVAIFKDITSGERRAVSKAFFDIVDDNNDIKFVIDRIYYTFCRKKNYNYPDYNLNALREFATKLKIKSKITTFVVNKIRKKAPQGSIEILKSYGFIFDIK